MTAQTGSHSMVGDLASMARVLELQRKQLNYIIKVT